VSEESGHRNVWRDGNCDGVAQRGRSFVVLIGHDNHSEIGAIRSFLFEGGKCRALSATIVFQ